MGLLRLLLFILAVYVAVRIIRTLLHKPAPRRTPVQDGGRMLRCEHCGIHFPEQEAVRDGGHVYCSADHRQRGPAA